MRRLLPLVLLAFVVAACGGDDEEAAETGAATTSTATTSAATTAPASESSCAEVEAPEPKADGGQQAPEQPLDEAKTWRLVFETSCGSFTVTLDLETAPNTSASLVSLAENGFYDGTTFHRVVPGFVIQGGDPTGTGAGGPGYQTVDPPPAAAAYVQGVVAMAKTEVEAPGTAGSQFFVVTGADIGLPADYAVVGTVTAGLETVLAIEALGTGDGPPSQPVVIERVTVESS
jgi:cyclophilin family peptidyl-prolyl cis-trans isomerase